MSLEFMIARRYLFGRKKSFISLLSIAAIIGVAIGVAALIIVMAVMNGFTTSLRSKILSASANGIITFAERRAQSFNGTVFDTISSLPEVKGVTPFVYSEVILSTSNGVKGVVVRGVEPSLAISTIGVLEQLERGSVEDLELDISKAPNEQEYGIIIGKELANTLGLSLGSSINLLSSSGRRTSTGFMPKVMPFVVRGIFSTGMYEYDTTLTFVNIVALRSLLGISKEGISGYEFSLYDIYTAPRVAGILQESLGSLYRIRTWQDMNVNLFAALELEKTAMFIFLTLIVLVGAFSIVTTLVMLVMEKRKDIAILMALGATPVSIRRIFLLLGMLIGVIGTSIGFISGISLSLLLRKYQFIKLPAGVYPFTTIPVLFSIQDIIWTLVCTLLVCFLATLYPSYIASKTLPTEALRYE
ncbi:MAG: ABC transporter permease [Desulfovibrionaceae bacterium]|nr:ABC transporter permease [Desulfovibrionaceae bacterium]